MIERGGPAETFEHEVLRRVGHPRPACILTARRVTPISIEGPLSPLRRPFPTGESDHPLGLHAHPVAPRPRQSYRPPPIATYLNAAHQGEANRSDWEE